VFGRTDAIEIVGVDDGTSTNVLSDLRGIAGVAPSPQGDQLVYSHAELTELNGKIGNRLSVSPLDGSTRRPLTIGDSDEGPDWRRRCTINGTVRNDRLTGSNGNDIICALQGNDVVDGRGGDDVVIGGDGNDRIVGGTGRDRLFGSGGDDQILARDSEQDVVMGGPGANSVDGDATDKIYSP
jgi:Ca2+-binding RTX toxin-like protein